MQGILARVVVAAAVSLAALPWSATAVMAKIPYISVEIAPSEPRPDEPITIMVRTWSDVDHTAPADWGVEDLLDGLFVIRPAGLPGPDTTVDLAMVGPARFEATLTLPAGDWELVAFPDRTGWGTVTVPDGYPDRVAISVHSPRATVAAAFSSLAGALAALIATVASLAAGFAARP